MQYDNKAGIKKPVMNWIIVESHKTQKARSVMLRAFCMRVIIYKYKRYLG